MTTPQKSEYTRPGAPSAKNARQAGALNHLQGSGETLMVGNNPNPRPGPKDPTVTRPGNSIVPGRAAYDNGRTSLVGGLPRQGKTAACRMVLLTDDELASVMAASPVVGGRDA